MVRIISTPEAESLGFQGFRKSVLEFPKSVPKLFFPSDGSEIRVESVDRIIMKIVEDISVGIQGRVDVPVAEPGLEDYGSHAGLDTAGRECVSQTMLAL